jgi:hypothetical protein
LFEFGGGIRRSYSALRAGDMGQWSSTIGGQPDRFLFEFIRMLATYFFAHSSPRFFDIILLNKVSVKSGEVQLNGNADCVNTRDGC